MAPESPFPDSLPSVSEASGNSAILGRTVCQKTAEVCARNYVGSLRAVTLTGSLARNEGTWTLRPEGWRLLGDAEFLLVFEARAPLPSQSAMASLEHEIQVELGREGILGHIQLTPVDTRFLTELQPRIFAYELRVCGRVVWGDTSVLSLIPDFSSSDILLEDAWRLLANRMIEHLETSAEVVSCAGALPKSLEYSTVKLCLDMATSLAVFAGCYAPTYGERRQRLEHLAEAPGQGEKWPFPLRPFAEQLSVATDLKLKGLTQQSVALGWDFWQQAVHHLSLLWHWELVRLTGADGALAEGELMTRWMRLQPLSQRLRGWMFVWRAEGWVRSWRWWARWARLAPRGSPRYWVYEAAQTLFGQLPEALKAVREAGAAGAVRNNLVNILPVDRLALQSGGCCWVDLVRDVAWNYHRFLEPTTA